MFLFVLNFFCERIGSRNVSNTNVVVVGVFHELSGEAKPSMRVMLVFSGPRYYLRKTSGYGTAGVTFNIM